MGKVDWVFLLEWECLNGKGVVKYVLYSVCRL